MKSFSNISPYTLALLPLQDVRSDLGGTRCETGCHGMVMGLVGILGTK